MLCNLIVVRFECSHVFANIFALNCRITLPEWNAQEGLFHRM